MNTLYILRHGQTEWNVERRIQGHMDSPLTELGRQQADTHGKTLKSLGGIDQLFVSPSGRARETAFIVNSYAVSPSGRARETAFIVNSYAKAVVTFESSLMERDCGEWSGQMLSEVEARYPQAWQARTDDPFQHRPPGGENLSDMQERVGTFLQSLYAIDCDVVGLVTHGVMSRVILMDLLGLNPLEAVRAYHPNDAFYRLSFRATEIETHYFKDGSGPQAGLLRHTQAETIAR